MRAVILNYGMLVATAASYLGVLRFESREASLTSCQPAHLKVRLLPGS